VSSFLCSVVATNSAAAVLKMLKEERNDNHHWFLVHGYASWWWQWFWQKGQKEQRSHFFGRLGTSHSSTSAAVWMFAENCFQLVHTKMCVKGADAKGRCARYIANILTLRWQTHRIQNKFRHTSNTFNFFSFGTAYVSHLCPR
jgi:hypothetical protein